MLFEEMLRDERAEGKAEAIFELLAMHGEVSEELGSRIMSVKDSDMLKQLLKCAAEAKTISEFVSKTNL